jgi:hypothetical protein
MKDKRNNYRESFFYRSGFRLKTLRMDIHTYLDVQATTDASREVLRCSDLEFVYHVTRWNRELQCYTYKSTLYCANRTMARHEAACKYPFEARAIRLHLIGVHFNSATDSCIYAVQNKLYRASKQMQFMY